MFASAARLAVLTALFGAAVSRSSSGGEPVKLDQRAQTRVEICYEQGDVHTALPLALHLLREGPEEERRTWAREHLVAWGLTPQEILRLDPGAMKSDELEALLTRLAEARERALRERLELEHMREVLEAAVNVRFTAGGQAQVVVNVPDLARAVRNIAELALQPQGGQGAALATQALEESGLTGGKLEAAQKAAAQGTLPADLQTEIAAAVCLQRLREYHAWVTNEDLEEEEAIRRDLGRHLGLALFRFCQKNYAETTACKREKDLMEYWRQLAVSAPPRPQKF